MPAPEWYQHTKCPQIKNKSQQDTYCVPHTVLNAPDIEESCCLEDMNILCGRHCHLYLQMDKLRFKGRDTLLQAPWLACL